MGLDITAYSKLRAIGQHEKDPALNEGEPGGLDDWCYYDGHIGAFADACFPASFAGLPILGTKTAGGSTFFEGGCYERTAGTEELGFRAGSYTGYGMWREDLARQFNPVPVHRDTPRAHMDEPDPDLPFYELIWFADNEGCIGELAAANLLADFEAHAGAYSPGGEYPDYYREKYRDWTDAFRLAANGGLVHFH